MYIYIYCLFRKVAFPLPCYFDIKKKGFKRNFLFPASSMIRLQTLGELMSLRGKVVNLPLRLWRFFTLKGYFVCVFKLQTCEFHFLTSLSPSESFIIKKKSWNITICNRKCIFNQGSFSIAMLVYQSVPNELVPFLGASNHGEADVSAKLFVIWMPKYWKKVLNQLFSVVC